MPCPTDLKVSPLPRPDLPATKHLRIAPSFRDVRFAVQAVRGWLRALGVQGDAVALCEQALAEALNNVVEHANLAETQGIDLALAHDGADLRCRILDHGRGYPKGALPEGTLPQIDGPLAQLPEGGFGWMMIRHIASDLRYERVGAANKLTILIPAPRG